MADMSLSSKCDVHLLYVQQFKVELFEIQVLTRGYFHERERMYKEDNDPERNLVRQLNKDVPSYMEQCSVLRWDHWVKEKKKRAKYDRSELWTINLNSCQFSSFKLYSNLKLQFINYLNLHINTNTDTTSTIHIYTSHIYTTLIWWNTIQIINSNS